MNDSDNSSMDTEDNSIDNLAFDFSLNTTIKTPVIYRSNKDNSNSIIRLHGEHQYEEDGKACNDYNVEWYDKSLNWVESSNISDQTIKNYKIIKNHNENIPSSNSGIYSKKKGFVYLRTSSPNNTSIQTQQKQCLDYCKKNGIKLDLYAEDHNISGRYSSKLKMMNNLNNELGFNLEFMESNHIIIVHSIDRLGRHMSSISSLLDKLVDYGVEIHFVLENKIMNKNISSIDKMSIYQAILQAEQMSDLTSEKGKITYNRLKKEGHFMGRANYGYKTEKNANGIRKKIINKSEMNKIQKILKLYKKHNTNIYYSGHYLQYASNDNICRIIYEDFKTNKIYKKDKISFSLTLIKKIIAQEYKEVETSPSDDEFENGMSVSIDNTDTSSDSNEELEIKNKSFLDTMKQYIPSLPF
jgi:DNA invertase Pin-like site-specific DNA recombinase